MDSDSTRRTEGQGFAKEGLGRDGSVVGGGGGGTLGHPESATCRQTRVNTTVSIATAWCLLTPAGSGKSDDDQDSSCGGMYVVW